jgi:poly(beta-D-mannuronate) lyase
MKSQDLFSLLLMGLCCFAGTGISAAAYWVSDVTDFTLVLQKVLPGDTIVWKNGSYADLKINFQPRRAGVSGKEIVLKAETAGQVLLTGSSQLMVGGEFLIAEGFMFEGTSTLQKGDVMAFSKTAVHSRITNCAVVDYTPADAMVNNNWMSLQGRYNEVDHCYFKGKLNQGPYLVVRYFTDDHFIDGSDAAPSTHHRIHHNYFGYRTMPTDNGGEDLRIGDSKTSFTRGFNIIEYNYFEDHRLEPEVISNKSCDNIYRFNTFINNDGALVLRHGQRCFVYGNYFDGKSGRNKSGGIRIINADQTVFNNYLENLEGGKDHLKAPITLMSGLMGSALNEYYPAHNAIVAGNTIVNSVGAVITAGAGNKAKGKAFDAPKNMILEGNVILYTTGKNADPFLVLDNNTSYTLKNNFYTNGLTGEKGFSLLKDKKIKTKDGFRFTEVEVSNITMDSINQRLAIHHVNLGHKEITSFNPVWKTGKKEVGVTWISK